MQSKKLKWDFFRLLIAENTRFLSTSNMLTLPTLNIHLRNWSASSLLAILPMPLALSAITKVFVTKPPDSSRFLHFPQLSLIVNALIKTGASINIIEALPHFYDFFCADLSFLVLFQRCVDLFPQLVPIQRFEWRNNYFLSLFLNFHFSTGFDI